MTKLFVHVFSINPFRGLGPLKQVLKGFKRVKGVIALELFCLFLCLKLFSLRRVVLYTVFMGFSLS